MIFGSMNTFAIEIGEVRLYPGTSSPYVQFRFWISRVPIGDWDDRISLTASTENARTICATQDVRHRSPFDLSIPAEVFQRTYEAFFSYDYTKKPVVAPNLRDQFHLDGIGMGAIQDKYGLALVESSDGSERVIAKDLIQERFVGDISLPLDFVESVLSDYIEWGKTQLSNVKI